MQRSFLNSEQTTGGNLPGTAEKLLIANKGPGRGSRWLPLIYPLYSKLDFVATGALIAVLVSCAFAASVSPVVLPYIDVDAEYFLDVVFGAQHGSWFSRNVTFTYGPLYQWLWALSSRIHGLSIGSFFRFGYLLPFIYTVLAIFAVSKLLLSGHPSWKRALYIIALAYPWSWFEVRHATVLLLFALCVYELDSAGRGETPLWHAGFVSLLVSAAFLGAADAGVYSVIAFAFATLCSLICFRSNGTAARRILRFAGVAAGFAAVWFLGITALFGFRFWTDTFATISTYRWALAMPMAPHDQAFLFKVIAVTSAVFLAGWFSRDPEAASLVRRPVFLMSAPLFALLYLQSSIVRADRAHVVFGLFPAMAFAGAIALGSDRSRRPWLLNNVPGLIGLAMLAHYNTPYPRYFPPFVSARISAALHAYSLHGKTKCPLGTSDLDGVCFPADEFRTLDSVSKSLARRTTPSDSIFAFPLENYYAILAKRRIAGGVLQNYLAVGDVLVQRKLEQLEADKPLLAVYSPQRQSVGVGGVPYVTRDPEIWLYLQSRYRKLDEIEPGILILQRDAVRWSRWRMETIELPLEPARRRIAANEFKHFIIADAIRWPANADLIRLRVLIQYPFLWHLRKPCRITVTIDFADGTTRHVRAVVAPEHEAEIWVFPWKKESLVRYFSPTAAGWHSGEISPPVRISMVVAPMDWISEPPTAITIDKLEAVRLSLDH